MIKAVFFDVANTLLDKPGLLPAIMGVFEKHGIGVKKDVLAARHRLLSEVITFPDKTSKEFYNEFNAQLLFMLGIIPNEELVDDIFNACTYLPWKQFDDVPSLTSINLPKGVISNWDTTLPQKLKQFINIEFNWILGSEEMKVRKPDLVFYKTLLERTGLSGSEVLYVGDSIRLDVAPALKVGIKAALIDRLDLYADTSLHRLRKMNELERFL